MPRGNKNNLRVLTSEEAREVGRKGGKASVAKRKKNKSLREAAQAILNGTYKCNDGEERTGSEMLINTLFQLATNPQDKQCISAMRLLREMTGDDVSPEQSKLTQKRIEQLEAEIEYRKKATDELGF